MSTDLRPRLGISLGDPAGIGPEVVAKALADDSIRGLARFVVFGGGSDQWAALGGAPLEAELIDCGVSLAGVAPGHATRAGGEASVRYVLAAIEAAQRGRIDGIVTAPISKEAIHLAGYPWPGHTEMLAEKFGAANVAMMFAGGPLRVVLVTIHMALSEAIRAVTAERILAVCRLGADALRRWFGVAAPRLGVCGLNPHAGEAGRFGLEERQVILPAIEAANAEGLRAVGPLAPDTAFHQALRGKFDLIVAMYHDQGLIPVKTVAFEESVNITLGLPIVRTSPDHGTAFDIAGRGAADPRSMKAAIRMAVEMVQRSRRP